MDKDTLNKLIKESLSELENERISENIVRDVVRECVSQILDKVNEDAKAERFMAYLVNEGLNSVLSQPLNEKNANLKTKSEKENDSANMEIKRNTVMKLLKNNKLTNSVFAYALWHPKDQKDKDTDRSLFSKKVNGTPDADGNVREFSDQEISKLYELLRSI